jgi:hypothetical protein
MIRVAQGEEWEDSPASVGIDLPTLMRQVPHEEKTEKEKEISVEDMQKIVDANEKLVKEMKDGSK